MKKKIAILLTLCMVFSFTISLTACGGGESGDASAEAIKIGFFCPESAASAAADGQSARQSAELAVQICNDNGGINGTPVELVKYDDGLDTTEAANIAEKLISSDAVDAVVSGSYSGPTKVAAPIFQDAGMVMVSAYAVHPDVVNAGNLIFSQSFPGYVQGTAAAKFAAEQLQAKKVAIVAVDLDFGTEQAEAFKAKAKDYGMEIVSEDYIAISDNDMTSVISKIKGEGVDLIYSVNYYEQAAEVCRQVKAQGLDVDILGTEGADSWQLLETAGEAAQGLYITTNMNRDDESEATQAYISKYRETYNMEPDMVGASVYDAFQVLFAAFAEAGTGDSEALAQYISGMTDFATVTGNLIKYTEAGSAVKPVQIQKVGDDTLFHNFSIIEDEEIINPDNY